MRSHDEVKDEAYYWREVIKDCGSLNEIIHEMGEIIRDVAVNIPSSALAMMDAVLEGPTENATMKPYDLLGEQVEHVKSLQEIILEKMFPVIHGLLELASGRVKMLQEEMDGDDAS